MIINYFDGKHLKTMALNSPDGKIYVYHLDEPILKKEFSEKEWYDKGIKQYVKSIIQTQKVFTKQTMPKLNYTVTFNKIKLNDFASKFLYSDETIAYNRRYILINYTSLYLSLSINCLYGFIEAIKMIYCKDKNIFNTSFLNII